MQPFLVSSRSLGNLIRQTAPHRGKLLTRRISVPFGDTHHTGLEKHRRARFQFGDLPGKCRPGDNADHHSRDRLRSHGSRNLLIRVEAEPRARSGNGMPSGRHRPGFQHHGRRAYGPLHRCETSRHCPPPPKGAIPRDGSSQSDVLQICSRWFDRENDGNRSFTGWQAKRHLEWLQPRDPHWSMDLVVVPCLRLHGASSPARPDSLQL